jgi:hypothetical protein
MVQGTPSPTSVQIAVTYFAAMSSLTQKPIGQTSSLSIEEPDTILPPSLSPLVTYAPVILFFALFISAFGIQLMRKVRDVKRILTAFAIAFFAASIPTVLTVMQQRSVSQTHAGPDEIPRNIQVTGYNETAAVVVWHTDTGKIGAVRLSKAPYSPENSIMYIADNGREATDHRVILSDLKPGTNYQFEVFSGTAWYDHNGTPIRFLFPKNK